MKWVQWEVSTDYCYLSLDQSQATSRDKGVAMKLNEAYKEQTTKGSVKQATERNQITMTYD